MNAETRTRRSALAWGRNAMVALAAIWCTRSSGVTGDARVAGRPDDGDGDGDGAPSSPRPARHVVAATGRSVAVEDFGAVGDGVVDDRAAIQKAIDTAIGMGIGRVRFLKPRYAVRHTVRTGTGDIHADRSGHGLVVDGSILLESACGRTDLVFRSPNGASLATDWQTVDGTVWRGGGIFLCGSMPDPGRARRNALILDGIHLQGGTRYTGSNTAAPGNAVGDGWDITHKGVWAENDYFVGDITLRNSGVIGFRGEALYQAGVFNGGLVLRNVEIAECNADAVNPGGVEFVDIEGLRVRNALQGFEGWGGTRGRMVDAVFENVRNGAGRLQGGTADLDPGAFFYAPKAPASGDPTFEVEATFRVCGSVALGSFLTGRITLIDTPAMIAPIAAGDRVTAIRLRIDAWADRTSFDVLTIYGASPVPHSDVTIEIHAHRTGRAIALGACVQSPVFGLGPLGEGIRIVDGTGAIGKWPRPAGDGFTGVQPVYRNNRWQLVSGDETAAHQVVVSGPVAIAPRSSNVYVIATRPGTYAIGFADPVAGGHRQGTEVTLYGDAAYGAAFVLTDGAGHVRLAAPRRVLGGGRRLSLRLTGNAWTEFQPQGG